MNVWIEPTRDGRHRVRARRNGKKVTLDTLDTLDEASTFASEVRSQTADLDESELVGDFAAAYLLERDRAGELDDGKNLATLCELHIRGEKIGSMALRALRRHHVTDWTRALRKKAHGHDAEKKLSRGSVVKCLGVLRVALESALERGMVRENVAATAKVAKERRTEDPWTYLTPEEQARLVGNLKAPERWIVAFAIGTGLRAGELVSLRLADVHADATEPFVFVRYGGAPTMPTKTESSRRRVPLFGIGLQAWSEWSASLPTFAKKNPLGLAFPGTRGGYRCHKHVLRWAVWSKAVDAAKLERNLRWHDLRHTCASSLVSGFWGRQWTLAEVKGMLGHSSIGVTERYAHVAENVLREAAAATKAAPLVPHTASPERDQMLSDISGAHDGARTRDLLLTKKESIARDHWENSLRGALVGQAVAILRRAATKGDVPEYAIALAESALDYAALPSPARSEAAS